MGAPAIAMPDDEQPNNLPVVQNAPSLTPPPTQPTNAMGVESQRAIAETQAAMIVAKQFPRDFNEVLRRITITCSRKSVAEIASYSFPRGGEEITGPSVYLLKTIAQEWGNLQYGVRELSRHFQHSTVEAFAWDMERNVRETRVFDVKHWRDTKKGGYALKEERDIYELIANNGSRRLRACLEGVIPEDVKAYAIAVTDKALLDAKVDTAENREKILSDYEALGVTRDRIEARLGKNYDAATAKQLLKLVRGITAIKDGVTTADEAFPPIASAEEAAAADKKPARGASALRERLKDTPSPAPTREPGEEG